MTIDQLIQEVEKLSDENLETLFKHIKKIRDNQWDALLAEAQPYAAKQILASIERTNTNGYSH